MLGQSRAESVMKYLNMQHGLPLHRLALRSGVTLAPGHIFSASEQYRNFIRLNAAYWSPEAEPALRRLGERAALTWSASRGFSTVSICSRRFSAALARFATLAAMRPR